ncbi:Next to BRCA1 protein 1 protein [Mactra antiquata]
MSDNVLMSVCYNGDETFVDMLEIPYNTVWSDLEAMFVARLDSSRVAVSYTDTENDEISIGSQEELFEAFRMAMKSHDQLMVKVMPVSSQANVFRMTDMDDLDEQVVPTPQEIPRPQEIDRTDGLTEPLDIREVCPDQNVAIPMPDVEQPQPVEIINEVCKPASIGTCVDSLIEEETNGEDKLTIIIPDSNQQLVVEPTKSQWEQLDEISPDKKEQSSDDQTSDKSDHLLQYSDFVAFMTKLKRDLRTEIVRDVTRKTVKHVLKGLDGAVIESLQGSSLLQGGTATTSTAASSKSQLSEHPVYVHDGVYCDGCGCVIVGARYKCGNCLNFDFCESCEDKPNKHSPDHVFVKMRRPCPRAGEINGVPKRLLRTLLYGAQRKCGTKLLVPLLPEGEEDQAEICVKLESKMIGKMAQKEEKKRLKSEKKIEKLKRKEEKLKRRIEGFSESPMKRERLELLDDDNTVRYDFYKVMMKSEFITDVTMPDTIKLQPETKFLKTWKMKNTGDGQWSTSTKLKLQWGNIPTPSAEVDVPCLNPGEEGNVSVDFVSPTQPGEYQSHWKLHENGMPFGARVWCTIIVLPRETLEPTTEQTDSLKVVVEPTQKNENEGKESLVENSIQDENATKDKVEITFRSTDSEEHLREVVIKRDVDVLEKSDNTSQEVQNDNGNEIIVEDSGIDGNVKDTGSGDLDVKETESGDVDVVKERGSGDSEVVKDTGSEDGFVVYAKHGDDVHDIAEVEKDKQKDNDASLNIAEDLSSAVARLTLEGENRETKQAVSYTNTPNNTPFDVTPLKTPNPEPEDDNTDDINDEVVDHYDMRPISNSSSVELVAGPDHDDFIHDNSTFVKQRMESLELKPDIDLDSVSSYSDDDDDDSDVSDSDYIIVPLPDCFDLSKPIRDMTLSSYSNSVDHLDAEQFSLDDNHNSLIDSTRSSRAVSVDEILTTSSSLPARPLSPTQVVDNIPAGSLPRDSMPEDIHVECETLEEDATWRDMSSAQSVPSVNIEVDKVVHQSESCATSEPVVDVKDGGSDVNGNKQFIDNGGEPADSYVKNDSVVIMIGSAVDQQGAVSSPVNENIEPTEGATGDMIENVVPTQKDCGAASASNTEGSDKTKSEETDDATVVKEPISASAQMPENVHYVKSTSGKKGHNSHGKTVDFAPEFANQLVTTAVNAAGQAYITAKAVFKTWQDKQEKQQHSKGARQKTPPTGWKPASTQYTPQKEDFKPKKSDWKPKSENWKPSEEKYEPPKSTWKPAESEPVAPAAQWMPPKVQEPEAPKEQWTGPPKEVGPMGRLMEMGFFDRSLNRKLLNKHNDNLEKVIQELLSMKNQDWYK